MAPLSVGFLDQSSGNPTSRLWSFGDGSTGSSQSFSHTYQNPGSYRVDLTVRNSAGQSSSATKTITVNMWPVSVPISANHVPVSPYTLRADIYSTGTSGSAPHRVDFSDISTGAVASRLWTFGDGYKSEDASPSHTYRENGTYTARLTVYDGLGQSDSASVTIDVRPENEEIKESTSTGVNGGTTDNSGTPGTSPPDAANIPLTSEDMARGLEAGLAGVIGGLIAIGAGTGIIPGTGRPPEHRSKDKFFVDEMKKRLEASNDIWKMQTEDLVRQQIRILKDNKYYVLNSTRIKSLFNNLIGNIGHTGYGFDSEYGWTGGNCDDFGKWGNNLYQEHFDELKYKLGGESNLGRVLTNPQTSDIRVGEKIGAIQITNGHGSVRNFIPMVIQTITNHTAVLVVRPNGERFVVDYCRA